MRAPLILTLVLLSLCCCCQELAYRQYTVKDGLPGSIVYQSLQDRNGFIWFATNQGVSRFDGRTFRNFSREDGLPDDDIVKLYLDKYNDIWFLSVMGIPSVFYHDSIRRLDNCREIKAICEDGLSDSIQMVSYDLSKDLHGYYRSVNKPGKWNFTFHPSSVARDATDRILRASVPQRLNFYFSCPVRTPFQTATVRSPYTEIHYTFEPPTGLWLSFSWPELMCISCDRNGIFFAGTDSLYYADMHRFYRLLPLKDLGLDQRTKSEVNSLFSENDSTLWICTRSCGLVCIRHPLDRNRAVRYFFQNSFCTSIIKDQEKGYWITTHSDGVYYLPNFSFYSVSDVPDIAVKSVRCIRPLDGRRLAAGLSDGNILIIDNSRLSSHLAPLMTTKNKNDRVMDIGPLGRREMLMGTDGGFYRISGKGRLSPFFSDLGDVRTYLHSIKGFCTLPNGNILVASSIKVVVAAPDGNALKEVMLTRCTCIAGESEEHFYWGTQHGMYLYRKGAVINMGEKFHALAGIINHIDIAPDSALWVSTGEGLVILRGDKTIQLTRGQGMPSNLCKHVSFSDSTSWISTDKGIARIDYRWNNARLQYAISPITEEDGLPANDVNQTAPGGAYIWAATARGISFFSKNYISHSPRPPLINITRLIADNSPLPLQDTISLGPEKTRLLVELSGISFRSGREISYEYRLQGLDSTWRHIAGNSIEFSAFPFGNYTLEVRAIDRWKTPSSVPDLLFIRHPPPFWLTTWFILSSYLLMALATGAGVYLFHRSRRRKREESYHLKKKMQDLEMMALRAQMNPHFIFNCLTSIQYHIMNADVKNASAYLHKFSTLIRQTLQNSTASMILLREEIKLLQLYLDLEKLRLGERMDYRIELDPKLDPDQQLIPPMIIQPYVENAVKHGISPLQGVKGMIIVAFKKEGDCICCTIDDNGPGISASRHTSSSRADHYSMGLSITEKRIHTLNALKKEKIHLLITDKRISGYPADGTLIQLFFPVSTN